MNKKQKIVSYDNFSYVISTDIGLYKNVMRAKKCL